MCAVQYFLSTLPQYPHERSGEVFTHQPEEKRERAGSCMTGCGCGFTDLSEKQDPGSTSGFFQWEGSVQI